MRKQQDRLAAALPGILEGYCNKSDKPREVAEEEAKTFIKVIEDSASYMFGFNHATGYSMLGYLCAYYRYYYPLEFCTAFLNCSESEADITAGTQLIRDLGYKIMPPKFGMSRAGFFYNLEDGTIYKSIDSIKYMSKAIAEELYNLSQNRFESFTDLLYALKEHTSLDARQLDILIKLNFFSDFGDPQKLLYIASRFDKLATRKSISLDKLNELFVERDDLARFSGKQTKTRIEELDVDRYISDKHLDPNDFEKCHKPKGGWSTKKFSKQLGLNLEEDPSLLPYASKIVIGSFSQIRNRDLIKYYEDTCQAPPTPARTQMTWQKEYLGYIEYTDPTSDPRIVMVMATDTKFSPKIVAYCLKSGETKELKIHKRRYPNKPDIITSFADLPVVAGDIIYLKKCRQEPRRKQDKHGNWINDYSVMDWWVKDYKIIDKYNIGC